MENPWRKLSKVNPQRENGRREINNICFQALIAIRLPGAIYQIVLYIIDRTWGFNRKESPISLSCFERETGLSRQSVQKAIKQAEELRLIVVERYGTKTSRYMFNKHCDIWKISSKHWETWLTRQLNHPSDSEKLGKEITPDWATKSPQSRQPAIASNKPTKENLKENLKENIYIVIFTLWNEQGIIQHRKLTDDMKRAVNAVLRDHTQEEICQSIRNYAEIVQSNDYWFTYQWTLKDFLKRGLDKFIDLEIARSNYRKEKGGTSGTHQQHLGLPTHYKNPDEYREDYHREQEVGA